MSSEPHHEDDLSSDPPQTNSTLTPSPAPQPEGDASASSNDNINNLLNEGFLEQKQRRVHREVAAWTFGIVGIIIMITTLIPMEFFLYTVVFNPDKLSKHSQLLQDKFYLFLTMIALISSTIPITLLMSIIRMVSSNKKQSTKDDDDKKDNNQELYGIISPFFEGCKNLLLLLLQKK